MKKQMVSFFILVVGALMGCSNDTSQTAATTTATYYLSNGTCYASTGAAVASTYCGVTTTGTYYWSNGLCYSSTTGASVATTYCSSTTTGGYYTVNGYCYAYATGQRSSRRIEQLCTDHVAYRVLCAQDAPDHCTIARFRAAQSAIKDLT